MTTTRRPSRIGILLALFLALAAGGTGAAEREDGAPAVPAPRLQRPAETPVVPPGLDDTLQPRVTSFAPAWL